MAMMLRYSQPYFRSSRAAAPVTVAGSVWMVAVPCTGSSVRSTAPNRPHGTRLTEGLRPSRRTFPLAAGVLTSSESPSRTTQTGVATASPDAR